MTPEEKAEKLETIKQVNAIFAFEGFYPTPEDEKINNAILEGRVTNAQAIQEMVEYAKEHKTTEGFAETRSWL